MLPLDLNKWVRVFGMYSGRDKFLRALSSLFVCMSTKVRNPNLATRFLTLAKQFSSARLVFRQLNHAQMLSASKDIVTDVQTGQVPVDRVDYALGSTVTAIYTVYGFVELTAWLADAKVIAADAAKWFKYCLYLWLTALVFGITRIARQLIRKPWDKSFNDRMTLAGFVCDFVSGVNSLPQGSLWAGKLSMRQASGLSFVASVIGLWRLF